MSIPIILRAAGLRLPRGRSLGLLERVRRAFAAGGPGVERVLVRLRETAPLKRNCVVEVHLRDGTVARVEEHRRRVGDVLARALRRAWQAVAPRLAPPPAAPRVRTR